MAADMAGNGEQEYGKPLRDDSDTTGQSRHLVPSDAPNASFSTGPDDKADELDSPPVTTMTFGNKLIAELDENKPRESSAGEPGSEAEPDVTADRKIPGAGENP